MTATRFRVGRRHRAALVAAGPLIAELPALAGAAVQADWDPALSEAMRRHGRVVHEELVLEQLVADLG